MMKFSNRRSLTPGSISLQQLMIRRYQLLSLSFTISRIVSLCAFNVPFLSKRSNHSTSFGKFFSGSFVTYPSIDFTAIVSRFSLIAIAFILRNYLSSYLADSASPSPAVSSSQYTSLLIFFIYAINDHTRHYCHNSYNNNLHTHSVFLLFFMIFISTAIRDLWKQ